MEFTLMSRKYINTGNEGTKTGVLRTRQQDPCNILKKVKFAKISKQFYMFFARRKYSHKTSCIKRIGHSY